MSRAEGALCALLPPGLSPCVLFWGGEQGGRSWRNVSFLIPGLVFVGPWSGGLGSQEGRECPRAPGSCVCTARSCHPFLGSLSSDGVSLPALSRPSSPWRTFLPLLSVFSFLTLWTRGFSLLTPTPGFTSGPALFLGISQHQDSQFHEATVLRTGRQPPQALVSVRFSKLLE